MNTSSYRHKAKEILKGRYGEGFFVVSVCIVAYLIFKAFDIAGAGIILYNNNADVSGLFRSGSIAEILLKIIRYIICFIVMSPLTVSYTHLTLPTTPYV